MEEKDFRSESNLPQEDENIESAHIEAEEIQFAKDEKNKKGKKSAAKEVLEWVQAIVIAVVLALVIRNFVFTVVRVDGQSMEPTLQHNDRMVVWRLGYTAHQGDIVIFNPPGYEDNVYWVKRIIATEGQRVEIDYGTDSVYVDGEKIDEPYLGENMRDLNFPYEIVDVPEGCVFVMGDNRNHSSDGRAIGPVSTDRIVGKAVVRFWPVDNMDFFN